MCLCMFYIKPNLLQRTHLAFKNFKPVQYLKQYQVLHSAYKYSFFPFAIKQWNTLLPIYCLSEHLFSRVLFHPSPLILISILFLTTTNLHHSFTTHPFQLAFTTFIAPFLTNFPHLCVIILLIEVEYLSRSRSSITRFIVRQMKYHIYMVC